MGLEEILSNVAIQENYICARCLVIMNILSLVYFLFLINSVFRRAVFEDVSCDVGL